MKTYVVCIDGTWNNPNQTDKDPVEEKEKTTETNVLRVYRFLTGIKNAVGALEYGTILPLQVSPAGNDAVGEAVYLNGVGSAGTRLKQLFEGATGTGTSERILDAYRFLATRHMAGDKIFIFGFSRGAFAARSLAGFLQYVGLPQQPRILRDDEMTAAFNSYRFRGTGTKGKSVGRDVAVDFLGVWDTVGALAFREINEFHLISPENVGQVAHALALDERREQFQPSYWTATGGNTIVDEVWFSGVHTNVGGGYFEEGLSNIALAWIVSKAVEAKLPSQPAYIQGWTAENAGGEQRDSYEEFQQQLGLVGRLATFFHVGEIHRTVLDGQKVHATVFERIAAFKDKAPSYLPAANLADGSPFPDGAEGLNPQRIVETPDYLKDMMSPVNHA
jgi:uncharacterized protein (DUF2235 family)